MLGDEALEPVEIGRALVNLRYLAVLLRAIGDLLDLGEGRVSSLLWAYLQSPPSTPSPRPIGKREDA